MSLFERKIAALDDQDRDYLRSWAKESQIWGSLGAYDKAADYVDLQEGQTHLDLGTGFGNVLLALRQRVADATLIGVDANMHMLLFGGGRVFAPQGFLPKFFVNQGYMAEKGTVKKFFEGVPEMSEVVDGEVNLVADDVRSLALLRQILGDRKIDSGSMILPGASLGLAFDGYRGELLDTVEKRQTRIREVMRETRQAAYKFLAERLEEGGTLVVAERVFVENPDEDPAVVAVENLRHNFGEMAKFWEIDKASLMMLSVGRAGQLYGEQTSEGLQHGHGSNVSLIGGEEAGGIDNVTLLTQKLVRNGVAA